MILLKAQLRTSNVKFLWTIQRFSLKEEAYTHIHIVPSAHFPLKDRCLLLHHEKMDVKMFCARNGNAVEHRVQSLYTGKHYIPHQTDAIGD